MVANSIHLSTTPLFCLLEARSIDMILEEALSTLPMEDVLLAGSANDINS